MHQASKFNDDEVLLTIGEVSRMIKKSAPSIYRLKRAKQFPQNIRVAGRSLWLRSEVIAYLNNCVEKRNKSIGV